MYNFILKEEPKGYARMFRGTQLSGEKVIEVNGGFQNIHTRVIRFSDIKENDVYPNKQAKLIQCKEKWSDFTEDEIVTLVYFE